jgi:hypothetical protein
LELINALSALAAASPVDASRNNALCDTDLSSRALGTRAAAVFARRRYTRKLPNVTPANPAAELSYVVVIVTQQHNHHHQQQTTTTNTLFQ